MIRTPARKTILPLALCLLLLPALVTALPAWTSLHGAMRGSNGAPVADGVYQITFAIYAVAKGGAAIWKEGPVDVAVVGGLFARQLGDKTPLKAAALAGDKTLYLGMSVGNDPELPRRALGSVPFALRANVAEAVACSGCVGTDQLAAGGVSADKVAFSYAGAKTKGGPASAALDLQCTGCVSIDELKLDGDLDLGGNLLKAKKVVAGDIAASSITATAFAGDGSKLTGIKMPTGSCKKAGEVVKGIAADGTLVCAEVAAPGGNLEQVSGGLLTNHFTHTHVSDALPVPIPDNNPIGTSDTIVVPDVGTAVKLTVKIDVKNSDLSKLKVELFDPNNSKSVLFSGNGKGTLLKTSYPDVSKPVSGNLEAWVGKNPKGKWRLKVIDDGFTNNKMDGAVQAWSVQVQVLSNKKLGAKGGFQFQVAAAHPMPCGATDFGVAYANEKDRNLYICNGEDWVPFSLGSTGTPKNPAKSCKEILSKKPGSKDGVYHLDLGGKAVAVWCDMTTAGGGWTQLLRGQGTTFEWKSKHWTTNTTLNASKLQPAWDDFKSEAFNQLPVDEVLLKSKAGKYTVLGLPSAGLTLLKHFQGPAKVLAFKSGAPTPLELVNGQKVGTCNPPWRINSKGGNAAWIRLGGWATKTWNCGYGNDASGSPTGAHLIGFGLRDDAWGPFKFHIKSFGIRDAHDSKYIGQLVSAGQIWGR